MSTNASPTPSGLFNTEQGLLLDFSGYEVTLEGHQWCLRRPDGDVVKVYAGLTRDALDPSRLRAFAVAEYVIDYETVSCCLTREHLLMFARIFNCSVDDLFGSDFTLHIGAVRSRPVLVLSEEDHDMVVTVTRWYTIK